MHTEVACNATKLLFMILTTDDNVSGYVNHQRMRDNCCCLLFCSTRHNAPIAVYHQRIRYDYHCFFLP